MITGLSCVALNPPALPTPSPPPPRPALQIHFEDFRMMTESFGMQLDDDSLLALYYVNDPQGSGFLAYEPLVEQLLDGDYFSLFKGHVDNSQVGGRGSH
jgi:hypothetical protein